jgi:N-acylneuraminate cytidylyltransferase
VIPARGGSKGVVGKNLRKLGGVPLVARAVHAAAAATLIDAVYVTTDDAAIAAVAGAAGARVIDRPADISGDTASSEAALLHALGAIDGAPDVLVFIQATSPFIDPGDLDAAIRRVLDGESDVVFAASASHAFLWRDGDTGATGVNHDASFRLRRQDSQPQYQETGAFYVMRAAGFVEAKFRFFGRVGIGVVPTSTAIEIDSEEDFAVAEAIARASRSAGPIPATAVVTDFDGVHTDDRVHVGADGTEFVTASRSDGMGVELLRDAGIPVLILSRETNPVVAARAAKLKVEVIQSLDDKRTALADWASARGIDVASIAYLGNDINDLSAMDLVGWPIAVADAHPAVLAAARIVLATAGGHGAVRELADRVLAAILTQHPSQQEKS